MVLENGVLYFPPLLFALLDSLRGLQAVLPGHSLLSRTSRVTRTRPTLFDLSTPSPSPPPFPLEFISNHYTGTPMFYMSQFNMDGNVKGRS